MTTSAGSPELASVTASTVVDETQSLFELLHRLWREHYLDGHPLMGRRQR